jgi:iron complex transport system permease protein
LAWLEYHLRGKEAKRVIGYYTPPAGGFFVLRRPFLERSLFRWRRVKAGEELNSQGRELYRRITGRKYVYLLVIVGSLAVALITDIVTGPSGLSIQKAVSTIISPGSADAPTWAIVWLIRLPVAATALIVGAGLGVAGAEMQTILGNPLASPYTLGISSAAGFGAALALVLGIGVLPVAGQFLVPLNAFVFALLCSLAVYFVAKRKQATIETIILTGIALHFLFSSLTALLKYVATSEELHAVVFWLFGDLTKATWPNVAIIGVVLLVILPLFARDAWKLTALRLGDTKAESLGVNVEGMRLKVLLLISILTATATCFVGTIGFVGLAAPHIARMLVGEDQRFYMPLAAISGALLLSIASIVSKSAVHGVIFPIGIVTSFIGIPFFLSLVLRKRERYW